MQSAAAEATATAVVEIRRRRRCCQAGAMRRVGKVLCVAALITAAACLLTSSFLHEKYRQHVCSTFNTPSSCVRFRREPPDSSVLLKLWYMPMLALASPCAWCTSPAGAAAGNNIDASHPPGECVLLHHRSRRPLNGGDKFAVTEWQLQNHWPQQTTAETPQCFVPGGWAVFEGPDMLHNFLMWMLMILDWLMFACIVAVMFKAVQRIMQNRQTVDAVINNQIVLRWSGPLGIGEAIDSVVLIRAISITVGVVIALAIMYPHVVFAALPLLLIAVESVTWIAHDVVSAWE